MEILASRVLHRVRDMDASLDFYERVLGLHRFREFGSPPHAGVVFFLGGGYLEITPGGSGGARPDWDALRLWLQVRDVAAEVDACRAAGVGVAEPLRRQPWGLIEAVIRDPDGLALVLVEIPEDHPMRRDTRGN